MFRAIIRSFSTVMGRVGRRSSFRALPILAGVVMFLSHAERIGAQTLTTVASFGGANGMNPDAGLTYDSAGNLYGTTSGGGASSDGTVFEIAKGSSSISTVASFNGSNGSDPRSGVTFDAAGNLYGATYLGGASSDGALYEIAKGANSVSLLASLNVFMYGAENSVLLDGAGNLYTTTYYGGNFSNGSVLELGQGSHTATLLASFTGINGQGSNPWGGLTADAAGNLWGTTYTGGTSGDGTVFEIPKGSNVIDTIATFTNTNGANPVGNLVFDAAGNLYGATTLGGANLHGTLFEIAKGSSTITTLASFTAATGYSSSGVTLDAAGNLYGTTEYGGANGKGSVYELAKGSSTITTLVSFNGTDGANPAPAATLALSAGGDFYGTTLNGGAHGDGTVFEVMLASVPEPASVLLLALGCAGLAVRAARSRLATIRP